LTLKLERRKRLERIQQKSQQLQELILQVKQLMSNHWLLNKLLA